MPISSPSYFPPQRSVDRIVGINCGEQQTGDRVFLAGAHTGDFSTISDLVLIGDNVGNSALVDGPSAGSVVVGSQSLDGFTLSTAVGAADPVTMFGFHIIGATGAGALSLGGSVLVGANILANFLNATPGVDYSGNVIVGTKALAGLAAGSFGTQAIARNVIAGYQAVSSPGTSNGTITDCVLLGYEVGKLITSSHQTVVIGSLATTSDGATSSIVVGYNASGFDGSIAIGASSTVTSTGTVLVGHNATAAGNATAIGQSTQAQAANTVALGFNANASAAGAHALGANTSATTDAVAVGRAASASAASTVAVGVSTTAQAIGAVVVGQSANAGATATDAVAVGHSANATAANTVAVGKSAAASQAGAVAVGEGATAGTNGLAVGFTASTGASDTALGYNAHALGGNGVVIGQGASTTIAAAASVVVGQGASSAASSIVIGQGASAASTAGGAIVIGTGVTATGSNQIAIGASLAANTGNLIRIGAAGIGDALYGSMGTGAFAIGGSTAVLPTLQGTNSLRLAAGAIGGANPVGGGYFYVTGANNDLHWVNSAGTDTAITPGGGGGGAFSGANPFNSTNTSIANNTPTVLSWDSNGFITDPAYHSTSVNPSRLTAPKNGFYQMSVTIEWAANATGIRQVDLLLNGSLFQTYLTQNATSAGVTLQTFSTIFDLTAGDFLEVSVTQTSGGALNVNAADSFPTINFLGS